MYRLVLTGLLLLCFSHPARADEKGTPEEAIESPARSCLSLTSGGIYPAVSDDRFEPVPEDQRRISQLGSDAMRVRSATGEVYRLLPSFSRGCLVEAFDVDSEHALGLLQKMLRAAPYSASRPRRYGRGLLHSNEWRVKSKVGWLSVVFGEQVLDGAPHRTVIMVRQVD